MKTSFNTQELADFLGVRRETARLIAKREPGVTQVNGRGTGKRCHRRTPLAVAERIKRKMSVQ